MLGAGEGPYVIDIVPSSFRQREISHSHCVELTIVDEQIKDQVKESIFLVTKALNKC
jgi:hypothetical protein